MDVAGARREKLIFYVRMPPAMSARSMRKKHTNRRARGKVRLGCHGNRGVCFFSGSRTLKKNCAEPTNHRSSWRQISSGKDLSRIGATQAGRMGRVPHARWLGATARIAAPTRERHGSPEDASASRASSRRARVFVSSTGSVSGGTTRSLFRRRALAFTDLQIYRYRYRYRYRRCVQGVSLSRFSGRTVRRAP